jgi:hypothetical protein
MLCLGVGSRKYSGPFDVPDEGREVQVPSALKPFFQMLDLPRKLNIERVQKLGRKKYIALGRVQAARQVPYEVLKARLKSWAESSPLVDPEKTMEDEYGERENACGDYYVGLRNSTSQIVIQNNCTPSVASAQPFQEEQYFPESLPGTYEVSFHDFEGIESMILVNVGNGEFVFRIHGPLDSLFFRRMGLAIDPTLQNISRRYEQTESLRGTDFVSNLPEELQDMVISSHLAQDPGLQSMPQEYLRDPRRYEQREALAGTDFVTSLPEELQDMVLTNV